MPRTVVQALCFLLGFWLALQVWPGTVRVARGDEASSLETALLAEVNTIRARHRLIPLERAPALDRVARAHSADMARRGYLSHETPEGANPVDRLEVAGIAGFTLAAENIGKTSRRQPVEEIVRGWLASPQHRRNLLSAPFNTTGLGVARAPDGSLIFTQVYITVPRH